ncbi:hypothetical protein KM043_013834 [Ampulex compressa]|nr:hypothetical protein KM043_013834 [Ampulex compressa]
MGTVLMITSGFAITTTLCRILLLANFKRDETQTGLRSQSRKLGARHRQRMRERRGGFCRRHGSRARRMVESGNPKIAGLYTAGIKGPTTMVPWHPWRVATARPGWFPIRTGPWVHLYDDNAAQRVPGTGKFSSKISRETASGESPLGPSVKRSVKGNGISRRNIFPRSQEDREFSGFLVSHDFMDFPTRYELSLNRECQSSPGHGSGQDTSRSTGILVRAHGKRKDRLVPCRGGGTDAGRSGGAEGILATILPGEEKREEDGPLSLEDTPGILRDPPLYLGSRKEGELCVEVDEVTERHRQEERIRRDPREFRSGSRGEEEEFRGV